MEQLFHVSSAANRDSIRRHGLDWTRMGAACGIAGSQEPEVEGIFLCRDEWEVAWFVQMNNTGGPVDVWAVTGIDSAQLLDNGSGLGYLPAKIPASQLKLAEWPAADVPRRPAARRSGKRSATGRSR
ncbi:MAG: hypothetical protein WAK71_20105 [Streptosporangiaceae bacterium]|jgi:hypothetical protein